MLISLDVPICITNYLFPTVDNFVAQCAADAEFVVLHWNNTRPCLRPCMVEAGLIHNWPSELFLTSLSLSFCLFFGGGLHLESCTGPDDFPTADVVFDVSGTSGTKWLGLHPFKFLLLLCVYKITTSLVLCWTVGVILTFMYYRSISQASNIGCEEDTGQPITLVSAYMCH